MMFYKRIICALFLIFVFVNPSYAQNSSTVTGNNSATQEPKPSTQAKSNNLIEAIKEGDLLHAKNLLRRRGVNVKDQDKKGRTALHWVAEKANLDKAYVDIVDLLIRRYAKVNVKDNTGDTPLHIAARYDEVEIMDRLISANADVNAQDNDLHTPLFWTTGFGYLKATQLLLDRDANARIRSKYNNTPLHRAIRAENNRMAIVKLLIEREVSLVLARNDGGKTALDVLEEELARLKNSPEGLTNAEEKEYRDLIELLQQEMATVKANIEANAKRCRQAIIRQSSLSRNNGKSSFNRRNPGKPSSNRPHNRFR